MGEYEIWIIRKGHKTGELRKYTSLSEFQKAITHFSRNMKKDSGLEEVQFKRLT